MIARIKISNKDSQALISAMKAEHEGWYAHNPQGVRGRDGKTWGAGHNKSQGFYHVLHTWCTSAGNLLHVEYSASSHISVIVNTSRGSLQAMIDLFSDRAGWDRGSDPLSATEQKDIEYISTQKPDWHITDTLLDHLVPILWVMSLEAKQTNDLSSILIEGVETYLEAKHLAEHRTGQQVVIGVYYTDPEIMEEMRKFYSHDSHD